MLNQMETRDK